MVLSPYVMAASLGHLRHKAGGMNKPTSNDGNRYVDLNKPAISARNLGLKKVHSSSANPLSSESGKTPKTPVDPAGPYCYRDETKPCKSCALKPC